MPSQFSVNEEREQLKKTLVVSAVAGLVMGLLYFGGIWRLRDSIRSIDSADAAMDVVRGPAMLFVILSLGFGWATAWMAARISGVSGPVLWIPVGLAGLVAIGMGLGLCAAMISSVPRVIWLVFALWGASIVLAAFFRMKLDE